MQQIKLSSERAIGLLPGLMVTLLLSAALMALPISDGWSIVHPGTAEAATADEFVQVAMNQLGKHGSSYGRNTMWCHRFVSWCAKQTGIIDSLVPDTDACYEGVNWYKRHGKWHSCASGYIPKRGDVIYFYTDRSVESPPLSHHVGIVTGYNATTHRVYTVEGNSSNTVQLHAPGGSGRRDGYDARGAREGRVWVMGYGETFDATPVITSLAYDFDAKGGSGSYPSLTVDVGGSFTMPSAKPVKTGFAFKGWAVKRLGDQKWFSANGGWVAAGQVSANGGYKLYAAGKQLSANDTWINGLEGSKAKYRFVALYAPATFTYKFSLRGGSGSFSDVKATYGGAFTMPSAKPTRSGYVFKGWAVKRLVDAKWFSADGGWVASSQVAANGGFKLYAAGKKLSANKSWLNGISAGYSNFRFYAQWEKETAKKYVYVFDLNDGTGDSDDITAPVGSSFTLPDKPVKTGYVFKGWAVKRLVDSQWFSANSGWVAADKVTANGGYRLYAAGRELNANTSWMTGCSYAGATVKFRFYAIWEAYEAGYRFDLRGGSGSFPEVKGAFGSSFTLPSAVPTKAGYTFKGWAVKRLVDQKYFSANSGWVSSDKVKAAGGFKLYAADRELSVNKSWFTGCSTGYSNFRFYAQWAKNAGTVECNFTYALNGGSGSFDADSTVFGSSFSVSSDVPTRSGYTFKGWAVKRLGDGSWLAADGSWAAKAELSSKGGYRLLAAGSSLNADASLVVGYTGSSRNYALYAQWGRALVAASAA